MDSPSTDTRAQANHRTAQDLPMGATDLTGNGRPDVLHFEWNGLRAVLIDEGGRFRWPDDPESFDWQDYLNRAFDVKSQPTAWNALRKGWGEPPEWLFYNEESGLLDVPNLRKRVFHKALEKAKLRQIRLHDLRHTYATLRIQAGHNIADVSKQLGHSSIRVTIDIYYHWIPGANRSEVNELDLKTAPIRNLSATSHEEPNEKRAAESANPL